MGCRSSVSLQAPLDVASRPLPAALRTGDCCPFLVKLERVPGQNLGLGLGSIGGVAVVLSIKPGGLLDLHNQRSGARRRLFPGCVVSEVNGKRGYWTILEELTRFGRLEIHISREPLRSASGSWFQEVESFAKEMDAKGAPFMLRLERAGELASPFSTLPIARAGDVRVERCAICLEEVSPDTKVMQLPCGHSFHMLCAGRWLTEGQKCSSVREQRCPLCCQRVADLPSDSSTQDDKSSSEELTI